jgi:hypothetical protein
MSTNLDAIAAMDFPHHERKSRWPARLDLIQSASGLSLGLFMWGHMVFVSSILLGSDAMWTVTKFFEGYFLFGKSHLDSFHRGGDLYSVYRSPSRCGFPLITGTEFWGHESHARGHRSGLAGVYRLGALFLGPVPYIMLTIPTASGLMNPLTAWTDYMGRSTFFSCWLSSFTAE